jgi:hypothetical protein
MRKGDDLTIFTVPKVEKIQSFNLPEPFGPPQHVVGHLYTYRKKTTWNIHTYMEERQVLESSSLRQKAMDAVVSIWVQ